LPSTASIFLVIEYVPISLQDAAMNSNLDKSSVSNNNFYNYHPVSTHFLSYVGKIMVLVKITPPFPSYWTYTIPFFGMFQMFQIITAQKYPCLWKLTQVCYFFYLDG